MPERAIIAALPLWKACWIMPAGKAARYRARTEANSPVNCGGCVVRPGDIVYGDLDGVVCAPADQFEELVLHAKQQDENEVLWRQNFEAGGYVDKFINLEKLVKIGAQGAIADLCKVDK
jgi:regulator of RNase E activity RraA